MKKCARALCLAMLIGLLCTPVFAGEDYELLINGDFEEITTHWEKYYLAAVDYCDKAHTGSGALQINDRQHSTDIARQVITKPLEHYGSGQYELSAWMRLADPEAKPVDVMIAIGVYLKDGHKFWFSTGWTRVTSEWTHLSGVVNISWSGALEEAEFYLVTPMDGDEDTSKNFRDMILDDCSMKVLGYDGEPYEQPTQAPVTTEPGTDAPETNAPEQTTSAPETTAPAPDSTPESTPEGENESAPEGESGNVQEQGSGKISAQTYVIAGTLAAVALILLGCGIALTVSYIRGKRNEAGQ